MILARVPQQTDLIEIPLGAAGTRATLKIMSKLTRQARMNPIIRATASQLVQHVLPGDYRSEVDECFKFVRDNIRYLQDANGMEQLSEPTVTLRARSGDCDDKSTLLASLLESIGHPCRFIAVGYNNPGEFEHVYLETRIGTAWVPCETTLNVPLGWAPIPPNVDMPVMAKMIEHT